MVYELDSVIEFRDDERGDVVPDCLDGQTEHLLIGRGQEAAHQSLRLSLLSCRGNTDAMEK